MLVRKNNHAAVPIKTSLGTLTARKYNSENGPARLPTMVENPDNVPIIPATNLLSGILYDFVLSEIHMRTTLTSIRIAIPRLNTSSGRSFPYHTPIRIPTSMNGNNFHRYFQAACRL